MAPAIPERWIDYTPVGKQIEGTRFICFKVPLRRSVITDVEEENRLDIDGLLNAIPNLGLIIDLTDTFRYYDPNIFENKGIGYKKVRIPGKMLPPRGLVELFKRHVQNYLENNKNNDKLIGVHCTHGVNRTGFLVCNYMISAMSHNADDAIQKFSAARGHHIERENYLRALQRLNSNDIDNYERRRGRKRSYTDESGPNSDDWRSEQNYKPKHFINYEDRWNRYTSKPRESNSTKESYPFERPRYNNIKSSSNGYQNGFHKNRSSYRSYNNQEFSHNRSNSSNAVSQNGKTESDNNRENKKWYKDDRQKDNREDKISYKDHRRIDNLEEKKRYKDNYRIDNSEDKKWYKDDRRTDNCGEGNWYKKDRGSGFKQNYNNHGSSSRSSYAHVGRTHRDS